MVWLRYRLPSVVGKLREDRWALQEKISNETKLCDKTKEEIQIVNEENDSLRLRIGELEPKFKNYYQFAFPNSLNSLHVPLPKISVAARWRDWHTIRESDLFSYFY